MNVIFYIVIFLLLIFYIINCYYPLIETFESKKDHYNLGQNIEPNFSRPKSIRLSIDVPIEDMYLSHRFELGDENIQVDSIYDYKIVMLYRDILDRAPTQDEMKIHRLRFITGEEDYQFLRMVLYNTVEYVQMKDLQINHVEHELEHNVYKKMLKDILTNLYMKYKEDKVPDDDMVEYLRDILVHFQFDMYLFIAFLRSEKYNSFEKQVLDEEIMDKYKLREILYENFIPLQLHKDANDMKEVDLQDGTSGILTDDIIPAGELRLQNIRRQEEERISEESKRRVRKYVSGEQCKYNENKNKNKNKPTKKIYDPISHNMPYSSKIAHNPPICTSLGRENNVSPMVANTFSGVKLEDLDNTNIGSIMPKFEYREYVEIK